MTSDLVQITETSPKSLNIASHSNLFQISALEWLKSTKDFTELNLCSASNLASVYEGKEWKMTSGHFEYCVMSYGFFITPSAFQDLINTVLRVMLGRFVTYIVDFDLLLYHRNPRFKFWKGGYRTSCLLKGTHLTCTKVPF